MDETISEPTVLAATATTKLLHDNKAKVNKAYRHTTAQHELTLVKRESRRGFLLSEEKQAAAKLH